MRYSASGAGIACSALVLGSVVLMMSLSPVLAAPAAAKDRDAASARAELQELVVVTTGSTPPAAEDGAGCQRSRRKLWVEGEGWIVRRVTQCQ